MRRAALATVLIVAGPVLGTVFQSCADRLALSRFDRIASELRGLRAARVTADVWRASMTIEGLTFRGSGFFVSARRLDLPLAPPSLFSSAAYAQDVATQAGTTTAHDIAVDAGALHYAIKSITLTGTRLGQADLDALFDPKSTLSIAARLGKLSASQISIPEIAMQTTLGTKTENDSYSNVVLSNVVNGRVGKVSIDAFAGSASSPEFGTLQTDYGPFTIEGLDLQLAARIISEPRKGDVPLATLYDSAEIAHGKLVMPKAQIEIDMGAVSAKDVKARPLLTPLTSAASLLQEQNAESGAQGEAVLADLLNSFAIGRLDLADLSLKVTDKDAPGTGTIGHFYLANMADAKIAEAGMQSVAVEAQGSSIKSSAILLRDMDLGALQDLAKSQIAAPPATPHLEASGIGEASVSGLDVDVGTAASGARTRFQVGKLSFTDADPVDGIPTHFATKVDHFTYDMKDAPQWSDFADLGYDKIDLSSNFDAHFDASKLELNIGEFSLSGVDMGELSLACDLANVRKGLFSEDEAQIEAAALGILMHRIEIRIENAGLFERMVAALAKKSNKTPDEIREAYATSAATDLPASLGNGPGAKALGAAVAKFVQTPKNLRIVAVSQEGLGVVDLALIKDPGTLMDKISIEAAADE